MLTLSFSPLFVCMCLNVAPGSIVEWPPRIDMYEDSDRDRHVAEDYESQFALPRGIRRDSEGYIVPSNLHLK